MDPQTGNGWKSSNFSHLSNLTTTELKKGLEDLAYKYEEIGQDDNNNFPFVCHSGLFISSNRKAQKRTFYLIVHMPLLPSLMFLPLVLKTRHPVSHFPLLANGRSGLVHVLEGSSLASAQKIILNETLSYYLTFFDPTFSVISPNPITVPRTLLTIPSNAGKILIYLKVVHHITLNTEHSPCLESENYSFASCINRKVSQKVGCRSFWTNYSEYPVCSDFKQYSRYTAVYDRLVVLERNKLRLKSGCLLPCSYMEYSVGY